MKLIDIIGIKINIQTHFGKLIVDIEFKQNSGRFTGFKGEGF